MVGSSGIEVERKVIAILRVLNQSAELLGARVIARRLEEYGIHLTERAVRYHLKLMDERGLTRAVGRSGRIITSSGVEEVRNALVSDKVGFVINRIELLAFQTTFDYKTQSGLVPVNTSLFPQDKWRQALKVMKDVYRSGLCVSDRVVVAREGEKIGAATIPTGKVGFATVCSIAVNGALLKAGIPLDSRFGGILQIRNYKPLRFVELIHYAGSSLDPSTVFITGKMTAVGDAAKTGEGKVLANFREIPAQCRPIAETVIARLKEAHLGGLVVMGDTGEPVCETAVEPNRVGLILFGGLNPVAAVEEAGIETRNFAMNSIVDYAQLRSIWEL
jgi:repressor of nif and glnA expression